MKTAEEIAEFVSLIDTAITNQSKYITVLKEDLANELASGSKFATASFVESCGRRIRDAEARLDVIRGQREALEWVLS